MAFADVVEESPHLFGGASQFQEVMEMAARWRRIAAVAHPLKTWVDESLAFVRTAMAKRSAAGKSHPATCNGYKRWLPDRGNACFNIGGRGRFYLKVKVAAKSVCLELY